MTCPYCHGTGQHAGFRKTPDNHVGVCPACDPLNNEKETMPSKLGHMPKYIVSVWREDSYGVTVEADNEEQAEEKAIEAFDNSSHPEADFIHQSGDQNVLSAELIK